MPSAHNDLKQMKQVRGILASVYNTQVTDKVQDNGNISEINGAILHVQNIIRWMELHIQKKE